MGFKYSLPHNDEEEPVSKAEVRIVGIQGLEANS